MDKLEKALEKARSERAQIKPASLPSAHLPQNGQSLSKEILDARHIAAAFPNESDADRIRLLRTPVLQALAAKGGKTLAITSPNYGDGKTTIALNLALSIAQDLNQTVLLVDLDLRKPSIASYLGLPPEGKGLTNHLIEGIPLAECLTRLSFERMTVLPGGSSFGNSSEILRSPQMTALADELRDRYPDRLIIYDMPPVLLQDDPLAFLPHVDGVLLVIKECMTKVSDLKRTLELLTPSRLIGTVLNMTSQVRPGKSKWIFSMENKETVE